MNHAFTTTVQGHITEIKRYKSKGCEVRVDVTLHREEEDGIRTRDRVYVFATFDRALVDMITEKFAKRQYVEIVSHELQRATKADRGGYFPEKFIIAQIKNLREKA